jgi:putative ABC transport system permease protein
MFNFLTETFRLGLKNLFLHKMRSLLTALGIIIGVLAVIVMVSIGAGSKEAAMKQLQQLGAKNILIRSIPPAETNQATGTVSRILDFGVRRADVDRLRTLPHLAKLVPMRNTEQKVTFGGTRANATAVGTVPEVFDVVNLPLSRGRYFTQIDFEEGNRVCVIGASVAQQLFQSVDPIGQEVQIGTSGRPTVICTVVGVLEPTGLRGQGQEMVGRDLDEDLYFPLNVAEDTFGDMIIKMQPGSMERKNIELTDVWLRVDDIDDVEKSASIAQNILSQSHERVDYSVKAPIQILRAAEAQQRTWNFLLITIASLSLVVGGIGIMNIMLATVTERTREVGIRRALGAKRRHIILQFLIETTVITLAGGLLGVGLGVGVSMALPWAMSLVSSNSYPTKVTAWSVLGSFIISGGIGIGFGLYPAYTAAQMNPIEALRHE